MTTKLKQTLLISINSLSWCNIWYVANWQDKKSSFVRINNQFTDDWFYVNAGKTTRQTLSYAKQHLQAITGKSSIFEYITIADWKR